MTPQDFLPELRLLLNNPAVTDEALILYITKAMRNVTRTNYPDVNVYTEQVLDSACHLLATDNKFPEIQGISQNGLNVSFSANNPKRYLDRMTERRQAMLMRAGTGCDDN